MRKELQELVDEFTKPEHQSEHWLTRLSHGVTSLDKLVGGIIDGIDADNRDIELPLLEVEIEQALREMKRTMDLPTWVDATLDATIPVIVNMSLTKAAENSSAVQVFRDQHLLPGLDKTIAWLLKQRNALIPDAPPFVYVPVIPAP